MKSWKEVRDYITANYEISEYDEDDDIITAMVFLKNGRKQIVIINRSEKRIGFHSVIGNMEGLPVPKMENVVFLILKN